MQRRNITDSISVRPLAVSRRTHYYQGRPNTVFLDRYQRVGGPRVTRRT